MKRALVLIAFAGCVYVETPPKSPLASFDVKAIGFKKDNVGILTDIDVVAPCSDQYGGQASVPAEAKGTADCPYAIPRGEILIQVEATALDAMGEPALDFSGPVSYRVVPGDLTGSYPFRWSQAVAGVAHGTVKTTHQYGAVRIWAEHAPPKLMYSDGGYAGDLSELPKAPDKWTYATGLSPIIWFEEPTLAKLQIPDGEDNRSSPLVGEFITVGKKPESGQKLLQSCAKDPARNGQVAKMVVTGTDPSGFFVTDITACRQLEISSARPPELPEACGADGLCEVSRGTCNSSADCLRYTPGTYGHMFVYNYSFPDGLDTGDLLWTLSGSVQEFTSTTQLTFPSWTLAERVHQLPQDQWNKWLDQVPIVEINGRMCGQDDTLLPFLTDSLCGHNKRNLKMESNESGLVRVRNVRFSQTYVNCDMNHDQSVPFFCEQTDPMGVWFWGSCAFGEVEAPADMVERVCNHDCVVGLNQYSETVCSEESTFIGFGQFVVELAAPGMPGTGLDSSLPGRWQEISLATSIVSKNTTAYGTGSPVVLACNAPAHYRFIGDGGTVDATDPLIAPGALVRHTLTSTENRVAVIPEGTPPGGAKCSVSVNARTRMNLITKDAVPDLQPDCSEGDPDPEKAINCVALHAATFDVIGHLRHVQPARPRWVILPRDADDVCCHPGLGRQCPKPIKPCP